MIYICILIADELYNRGFAFSISFISNKLKNLLDNKNYLSWKRKITKVFRMIKLLTFIEKPDKQTLATKKPTWMFGN